MANKRYDQFAAGSPATTNITLFADPATGALNKCTLATILALQTQQYGLFDAMRDNGLNVRYPAFGMNPIFANTTTFISNNTAYFFAIPVTAFTTTGVFCRFTANATFVANNFNGFALYQNTGSLISQVAITANSSTIFTSSTSNIISFPWVSTVALTSAFYWLAMVWNASSFSAQPRFTTFNNGNITPGSNLVKHTNLTSCCTLASQNTLASTYAYSAGFVDTAAFPILGIY